jgi:deoxyribonuclease V
MSAIRRARSARRRANPVVIEVRVPGCHVGDAPPGDPWVDQRHHGAVRSRIAEWPSSDEELVDLQYVVAREAESALSASPWLSPRRPVIGGCFVAFARGEAGPGHPGDRAWAAAVAWRADPSSDRGRRVDGHLRGARANGRPRQADDVLAQSVAAERVPASYAPGLLARREGPVLAMAFGGLASLPDVLLVDATGIDHPRRAGLAVHLGAVIGVATVGVTKRPLVASGRFPPLKRGARTPVCVDDRCVGFWVCTKTAARPVVAHAGWRTSPEMAAETVLVASTEAARTPVPLQEARRVAREARAVAGAD